MKALFIKLDDEKYQWIRKRAYLEETKMVLILRKLIDEAIQKEKLNEKVEVLKWEQEN